MTNQIIEKSFAFVNDRLSWLSLHITEMNLSRFKNAFPESAPTITDHLLDKFCENKEKFVHTKVRDADSDKANINSELEI